MIVRVRAGTIAAVALLVVYALTLAPNVTFWDAGEFIASARSLGIPHPPGTPLFVLMLNVWATLLAFVPYAVATNFFSATCTALAAGVIAEMLARATANKSFGVAAGVAAGAMSSVWLNATETEVYAASLALGVLMLWAGERAGRETPEGMTLRSWVFLLGYLMVLAVPLHLSALVAAPAAILLACWAPSGTIRWRRAIMLAGVFVVAMGIGRMSLWFAVPGSLLMLASRGKTGAAMLSIALVAASVLLFMYVRAAHDPAINQGDPRTLATLAYAVARKQYDVAPIWPRQAPVWVQLANFGQYADWQVALSLGPTVMPSLARTICTVAFVGLGYLGSVTHWRLDRRTWLALLTLFACGSLGVAVYLNLKAGPSIGYGILPADVLREARERDYFYVFAFWIWGVWAGVGAVAVARRLNRPDWTGVLVAAAPIVLNWRAVTRRAEPEAQLPLVFAQSLLESTPPNGVLFVMGDNDSYPVWYAQQVKRTRQDVAVITVPLLPARWYREQIASRFQLLDTTDLKKFPGTLKTASLLADRARAHARPVAASMSMTAEERARIGDAWRAIGMVYVNGATGIDAPRSDSIATRIESALGDKLVRDAIDPAGSYFRQMLSCPRELAIFAQRRDFTQLDSICNYR